MRFWLSIVLFLTGVSVAFGQKLDTTTYILVPMDTMNLMNEFQLSDSIYFDPSNLDEEFQFDLDQDEFEKFHQQLEMHNYFENSTNTQSEFNEKAIQKIIEQSLKDAGKEVFEQFAPAIIIDQVEEQEAIQEAIIVDPETEDNVSNQGSSGQNQPQPARVNIDPSEDTPKRLALGPSQYDSRIEPLHLNPTALWAKSILDKRTSVGMVILKEHLQPISDSLFKLTSTRTLGKRYGLCPDEAFFNQPAVGVGTAFIIGDSSMATANHVYTATLDQYAVIFGFEVINTTGTVDIFVHANDIYLPTKLLTQQLNMDVAVFQVDRGFNRPVLEWSRSSEATKGKMVYMIGYPMGIPQKVALNATIVDNSHTQYFYTSLDAFQGNSGSPVFDFATNKVIGILVSGELDYQWNGSCNESTLCRLPYCKGEKVMRIEKVLSRYAD